MCVCFGKVSERIVNYISCTGQAVWLVFGSENDIDGRSDRKQPRVRLMLLLLYHACDDMLYRTTHNESTCMGCACVHMPSILDLESRFKTSVCGTGIIFSNNFFFTSDSVLIRSVDSLLIHYWRTLSVAIRFRCSFGFTGLSLLISSLSVSSLLSSGLAARARPGKMFRDSWQSSILETSSPQSSDDRCNERIRWGRGGGRIFPREYSLLIHSPPLQRCPSRPLPGNFPGGPFQDCGEGRGEANFPIHLDIHSAKPLKIWIHF